MMRRLMTSLVLLAVCGCGVTTREVWQNVVLPEQRAIEHREASELPSMPIPANVPPHTVSKPPPKSAEWHLSLDEAVRIALENAQTIRVLAGTSAVASGQTIYDAAITNTTIDQARGRF